MLKLATINQNYKGRIGLYFSHNCIVIKNEGHKIVIESCVRGLDHAIDMVNWLYSNDVWDLRYNEKYLGGLQK